MVGRKGLEPSHVAILVLRPTRLPIPHRPTNLVVLYMIETNCPTTIIVKYINFPL